MSDAGSPSAVCPKCGQARPDGAEACARCGLVYANWNPELAAEIVKLDEAGEALWAAVQAAWDDTGRHDAFVKHCSQAGLLAAAGRCYRERLARAPVDPVGRRMQERIVLMASAVMGSVARSAAVEPVTRAKWFWLVIAAAVAAAALAALLRGRD